MTRAEWLEKVQSLFPREVQNNLHKWDWRTLKWTGRYFRVRSKTGRRLVAYNCRHPHKVNINVPMYSMWDENQKFYQVF